jgi:hypothetical protein
LCEESQTPRTQTHWDSRPLRRSRHLPQTIDRQSKGRSLWLFLISILITLTSLSILDPIGSIQCQKLQIVRSVGDLLQRPRRLDHTDGGSPHHSKVVCTEGVLRGIGVGDLHRNLHHQQKNPHCTSTIWNQHRIARDLHSLVPNPHQIGPKIARPPAPHGINKNPAQQRREDSPRGESGARTARRRPAARDQDTPIQRRSNTAARSREGDKPTYYETHTDRKPGGKQRQTANEHTDSKKRRRQHRTPGIRRTYTRSREKDKPIYCETHIDRKRREKQRQTTEVHINHKKRRERHRTSYRYTKPSADKPKRQRHRRCGAYTKSCRATTKANQEGEDPAIKAKNHAEERRSRKLVSQKGGDPATGVKGHRETAKQRTKGEAESSQARDPATEAKSHKKSAKQRTRGAAESLQARDPATEVKGHRESAKQRTRGAAKSSQARNPATETKSHRESAKQRTRGAAESSQARNPATEAKGHRESAKQRTRGVAESSQARDPATEAKSHKESAKQRTRGAAES